MAFALAGPVLADETCDPGNVWLRNSSGQVQRFSVELADDAGERAQGLMHREAMAAGAGMLFVYPAPTHAVFWMKNTLMPLDMLFFDPSGRLQKLHSQAQPLDLTQIDGGGGVAFVLEINGGLATRMGIGPGSVMRHPAIQVEIAAWPCE